MPPPSTAPTARRRRLTQQQRSAATREALVDSTIECLVELGYERSTTSEISERAGLSRGAHLHHFQTRATLMAAAVETLALRGKGELERGVHRLPEGEDRPAAALDMLWRVFNGRLFQVVLELSVHARTDAELRVNIDPIEAMLMREAVPLLRRAFAGDPDDRSADGLITMATATIRGLAMMPLLEPRRRTNGRWPACRAQLLSLFDQRRAG